MVEAVGRLSTDPLDTPKGGNIMSRNSSKHSFSQHTPRSSPRTLYNLISPSIPAVSAPPALLHDGLSIIPTYTPLHKQGFVFLYATIYL